MYINGFLLTYHEQFRQSLEKQYIPVFIITVFTLMLDLPVQILLTFSVGAKIIMTIFCWSMIIIFLNLGQKHLKKPYNRTFFFLI